MTSFWGELKRRNVVRVTVAYVIVGWLILQLTDILVPLLTLPEWVGRLIFLLLLVGFPLALFFAWAYELTPEGLKKEKDVDRSESITHVTGRKLDFVIIAVMALAIGYFAYDEFVIEPAQEDALATDSAQEIVATPRPAKSIAVLPFVNMSPETGQEWFTDGLTEEILNSLARTPDLLVAARTSSFNYRNSDKDIPEIAKALGVEHILEGSVRRSGERLRITAQLVRAADGFQIWSESYDRTMEEVIRIQEEVAIQIANALETAMDPEALARMVSAGTRSVPAYEAYLRGLSFTMNWFVSADIDEYLAGIDNYERAVALDPEFALAYSEVAEFWRRELRIANLESGQSDLSITEIRSRFEEAMDNAIRYEKDPVRQIFYRARNAMVEMKFLQALRLVTSYLEKRPYDHEAQVLKLSILPELAMYEEAAEAVDEFYARDGYSVIVTIYSFLALNFGDDHDTLRDLAEKSIERFPENVSVLYQAHRALLFLGDVDSAGKILPIIEASDFPADNRELVALRQACAEGKTATATRIFDNLLANHPDDISAIWLSRKILGRDDEATQMLQAFDNAENMTSLVSFLRYGHFDPSQYPNLLGMLAAQGIEPRPLKTLPYRCRN